MLGDSTVQYNRYRRMEELLPVVFMSEMYTMYVEYMYILEYTTLKQNQHLALELAEPLGGSSMTWQFLVLRAGVRPFGCSAGPSTPQEFMEATPAAFRLFRALGLLRYTLAERSNNWQQKFQHFGHLWTENESFFQAYENHNIIFFSLFQVPAQGASELTCFCLRVLKREKPGWSCGSISPTAVRHRISVIRWKG